MRTSHTFLALILLAGCPDSAVTKEDMKEEAKAAEKTEASADVKEEAKADPKTEAKAVKEAKADEKAK